MLRKQKFFFMRESPLVYWLSWTRLLQSIIIYNIVGLCEMENQTDSFNFK